MKICILQPDYSTTNVDYKNYDPPRNLNHLLCNTHTVHYEYLNKLTTYKQLQLLATQQYDIFINLCEGYLEWEVPSLEVITYLELLNLPYTGPNVLLYDPPKTLMKYVAYTAGVKTPLGTTLTKKSIIADTVTNLCYPLFVKPSKAGDSLGIDNNSLINNEDELTQKINTLLPLYNELLIEEYIKGREFTVLVVANNEGKGCVAYPPIEYIFLTPIHYKTYAHKTSALHTNANIPCNNAVLAKQLQQAAEKIFTAFEGVGYARLDFRVDAFNEIYFLEINFTCSVFYDNGYQGSADYILELMPNGKQFFLQQIINEGIARHNAKQKCYEVKGNAIAGYGIFATAFITKGQIVYKGEEKAQRIVTKHHVHNNWGKDALYNFKHYAYPISNEVYILWDADPNNWAPQNHSCAANTQYNGLNVIANADIMVGQELTLDYALFLNDNITPFACTCNAPNCRKLITGTIHNRITNGTLS